MNAFQLFLALTCISTLAAAEAVTLPVLFKGTVKWELDPAQESAFSGYLTNRTARLAQTAPYIKYPTGFTTFGEGYVSQLVSVSKNYQQRESSCRFLKKLHADLSSEADKKELLLLTNSFNVCTPGDAPAGLRTEWSTQITETIWNKPWIEFKSQKLSLSQYLSQMVGSEVPLQTKVIVSEKLEFDGYAYARSKMDREFASKIPALQKIFDLAKNFRPDQPESVNFGPDVSSALKEDPYGLGGFLITAPTIIISNSWAPADLPELLAHEYGHIYHALLKNSLKLENGVIAVHSERSHSEGVAESFAAQALCHLYERYPEFEFMHLIKLQLMATFRKQDPHYVGAAAFASKFHFRCEEKIAALDEFASAESISVYLQKNMDLVPPKQFGIAPDFLINFLVE
jgi:hypothetical protein